MAAHARVDGQLSEIMMALLVVPPQFIDRAWKEGASCLAEACEQVDEITGSQLKLILARGERHLVQMTEDEKIVGWVCFRVDQLPNVRVFHITDMVAHNGHFEQFFDELKQIALSMGCSEIRYCPSSESRARLFKAKAGAELLYSTYRIKI